MEEEFKCPLCLDFFTPPVRITSCGHNYCQQCLAMFTATPWRCPVDQIEQQQSPEQLTRNYFLERALENFNESRRNICGVHDMPMRLHCLKHDRSLCHECKDVGMCDGQPADDCDVMNLAEFENTLKDRLTKLDDQFTEMADVLKTKKEAFIEMYRKNPRISHEEAVSSLLRTDPDYGQERNAMQEQLAQLQAQHEVLEEQLSQHQDIAAEAEHLRRQLAVQKQQFNEEKGKSQTLLEAIKNLEGQLENERVARNSLEFEKTSIDQKLKQLKQDQIQVNDKLAKTNQEKTNLVKSLKELQSSLSAAKSQNEELQSVLDNVESEKSNLAKELKEMKKRDSNPKIEELTNDLKAVALSETDADGDIRRLNVLLQETQSRVQDAERIKAEQARRTENLERKHGNVRPKRGGRSADMVPLETVGTTQITESKQTIVCNGFSDDNVNVTVSSCKQRVKGNFGPGYCYLDHPKIKKNQVLQWILRVPKHTWDNIGMVIILE